MYSYRVSGLAVASEVDLPGLIPGNPDQAVDVTIRRLPVPMQLDAAEAIGPTWQRAGNRFLLRIPNIARFLLEDGRSIAFEAEDAAEPQDVAVFLSGSVFGILLHQRNHLVLHASAVLVGGRAVLFCGVSGAGKSTLAAALVERGYPLVADDQCAIERGEDGIPRIHADGRQLRLWEKSIAELGLAGRRGDPMRNRLRKFYVDPAIASDAPVAVGAIYALVEIRDSEHPLIERPNVVDATKLLAANAYRPLLVRRLDQRETYFQGGAAIVAAAGIFRLKRPLGFDRVAATIAKLQEHWASIGLGEGTP
ncbi:MAG: HPr kinase/phosphorylase [Sphingomonas sp.]|uniref:HPr kinase/phosphorylase n=1 Tax=Sphingomonas sp. TaxID=28214 RepID=UPI003F7F1B39